MSDSQGRVYSRIAGTGSYLPEKVLTNADLTQFVETSDEWIVARTGIRERHVAAEGETTSDLGYHAALRAMEAAGVTAADTGWTSTTSDFFEVRGRLRLDDVALEEVSVVQRTRTPIRVTTLWRERAALSIDLGTAAGQTTAALGGGMR